MDLAGSQLLLQALGGRGGITWKKRAISMTVHGKVKPNGTEPKG